MFFLARNAHKNEHKKFEAKFRKNYNINGEELKVN